MDYTVEELSPVKKKIKVAVPQEEVGAAIKAATAAYRQNVQMDGFRKGKVPEAVVKNRFHDAIVKEAREDLINVHINDALQKLGITPIGSLNVESGGAVFEEGKPYEYSIEVETLPEFELPNYEGLEVEEERPAASEALIDHMLERMRKENAALAPASGDGPAKDGQIAVIDFETYLDGKEIKDFTTKNFELELGRKSALPEFEQFVQTIPVGHTAEKAIPFPADFIAPELAGKEAVMKVTVHAVKERRLPDLDDKFAQKLGRRDLADLRQSLARAYSEGMGGVAKGAAQRKLLDALLKQVSYELPQSIVDIETSFLAADMVDRAEREGKSIARTGADVDKLKQELRPRGEARAREKVLLLAIAKKEKLEVAPEEVNAQIARGAKALGQDLPKYFAAMRDTGMIFQLRDNMLCDKAMDLVYERADVKVVEPKAPDAADEGEAQAPRGQGGEAQPEAGGAGEAHQAE